MAQLGHVLLCLTLMTAVWTVIGLPFAARLALGPHRWLWAPGLGWAVANVVSLPLFEWVGMAGLRVHAAVAVFLVLSVVALFLRDPASRFNVSAALLVGVVAAAALALVPVAGVMPKITADGVALAPPIFDHSKIALIDEMIRSGVPAGNPFFSLTGTPGHIAYYYLWHFSAAVAAIFTGVSGWEADAALTGFTAFASLLMTMGLALQTGARPWAGTIVVALAAAASLRTTLGWLWPDAQIIIGYRSGFGGWLFQTCWAPQHVASAMCTVMACMLLVEIAQRPRRLDVVLTGIVAAAAFQSSVWVGGIVLSLAAPAIVLLCVPQLRPGQRLRFIGCVAIAGMIAAALAMPFIYDQLVSASLRGHEPLLALTPTSVLDDVIPEPLRQILDVPAFWLVYLPVEFPAFYLAGLLGLGVLVATRNPTAEGRIPAQALCLVVAISLTVSWLLASVIGDNNDLGWRAVLPAVMILIAVAAGGASRWPAAGTRVATVLAAAGFFLSLPETGHIIGENLTGLRKPSARAFAASPELWSAVRKVTPLTGRIADNPLYLADMTPWPVNISWALLADRRSCYAGLELAIPFAPISADRRTAIEAQFTAVFSGDATPGDIEQLAGKFHCDTIVVTPQDGAWLRDPFASSAVYSLVDFKPNAWKIYRLTPPPRVGGQSQIPENQLKPRSDQ